MSLRGLRTCANIVSVSNERSFRADRYIFREEPLITVAHILSLFLSGQMRRIRISRGDVREYFREVCDYRSSEMFVLMKSRRIKQRSSFRVVDAS